ncbi:hypothetical protein ASZ90_000336 [hydrocarbon metagenome]|uniref:Uncharacterized protein n=1 Tax=hydrocarbon metagenome TaxID=938273 RepID=A0A0W8G9D7_9ZZZZ
MPHIRVLLSQSRYLDVQRFSGQCNSGFQLGRRLKIRSGTETQISVFFFGKSFPLARRDGLLIRRDHIQVVADGQPVAQQFILAVSRHRAPHDGRVGQKGLHVVPAFCRDQVGGQMVAGIFPHALRAALKFGPSGVRQTAVSGVRADEVLSGGLPRGQPFHQGAVEGLQESLGACQQRAEAGDVLLGVIFVPSQDRCGVVQVERLPGRGHDLQKRPGRRLVRLRHGPRRIKGESPGEESGVTSAQSLGKVVQPVQAQSALPQFLHNPGRIEKDAVTAVADGLHGRIRDRLRQMPPQIGPDVLQILLRKGVQGEGAEALQRIEHLLLRPTGDDRLEPAGNLLQAFGQKFRDLVPAAPGGLVQGVDDDDHVAVGAGKIDGDGLGHQDIEERQGIGFRQELFDVHAVEADMVFMELGAQLPGNGEHALARVGFADVLPVAEEKGGDFPPVAAQPGGEGRLAAAGPAGQPEESSGVRIGQPGVHGVHEPLPAGETDEMPLQVRLEGQKIGAENALEPRLSALEIKAVML